MSVPSKSRAEIVAEIEKLSKQHSDAVQDATFMGWQPRQMKAHEERAKRIGVLRNDLAEFDDPHEA